MKVYIVALAPIILLLWVVFCSCFGVLKGTIITLVVMAMSALLTWWLAFVVENFSKEE